MALIQIRPLPAHCWQFHGKFAECRLYPDCASGHTCRFAHSSVELDTWNIKKRILRANPTLLSQMVSTNLVGQSPSNVCRVCFEGNSNAVWLLWLKCTSAEEHKDSPKTTVTINSSSLTQLVRVRDLPTFYGNTDPSQLALCGNQCHARESCRLAHSNEELNYWKWQLVKKIYTGQDPDFLNLLSEYEYPEENSLSLLNGVTCVLTTDNYSSKYHKLVYLDELAHSRKMMRECDGDVSVSVPTEGQLVSFAGMKSAAMDYADHNRAEITLTVNGNSYAATISERDYERDELIVRVHSYNFLTKYKGRQLDRVSVHFDISHSYYNRLHKAIHFVNLDVLQKLLPDKASLSRPHSRPASGKKVGKFQLDKEYQSRALRQMLACNPNAPFLLLGPFGTGKTHVLAAAVAKLLEDSDNKVLVCTHLNRGADGLYGSLQKRLGYRNACEVVVRLVPNQEALEHVRINRPCSCSIVNETPPAQIDTIRVIVTTFLTAMQLREMEESYGVLFSFTHILIDEGAQSPEPEALGALVLAEDFTKVIIVGDNKQVGPQVSVLNKVARENGLGTSILERLFRHYNDIRVSDTHTATLLTNYRCHPSILTLASSLLYECTLLSRSNSKTHPLAPYPLMFACTSMEEDNFSNCPTENKAEAKMLIEKMLKFIEKRPLSRDRSKPIGLLAPTRQQVACLRKLFRQMKPLNLPCKVEIIPTYNIQGEEFEAVFLSTTEPTDNSGRPRDKVKSICNEFVFNTVITRARSLVYSAGNPFRLLHASNCLGTTCWIEYIRRCIQCQTLVLPDPKSDAEIEQLPKAVEHLSAEAKLLETIVQATTVNLQDEEADIIVNRYISDLQNRREYQVSRKLVQDPRGELSWVESDPTLDATAESDGIVWCRLDCKNFRTATAFPIDIDTSQQPIKIDCVSARKGAFHGDLVKVDIIKQCVLFDEEMERAVCESHFGETFLCRVEEKNPIIFFPIDKRHPKFVNLPTLTSKEKEGVVCFDPNSINSIPKVNNFIPIECAVRMLFIVKFLGWQKKYYYPLGIIVGALPPDCSPNNADIVLRLNHNIPVAPHPEIPSPLPSNPSRVFTNAITIDPKGAADHDDTITYRLIGKNKDTVVSEIGVHITDVRKFVPQGGELDEATFKRGCSAYRSHDMCASKMLPHDIIQAASIVENEPRNAFSVLATVAIQRGTVQSVSSVTIVESEVTSTLELTYSQAQTVLSNNFLDQHLLDKLTQYDCSQLPTADAVPAKEKLRILWKVAHYLRVKRLGLAAHCYLISDPEEEEHPEAHFLIAELMIWANQEVAKKLLEAFPNTTILRTQERPNEELLQKLAEEHGQSMALSLALRKHLVPEQQSCSSVSVLQSTFASMQSLLREGKAQQALHLIQFEHLHPQLAVPHALFHQLQSQSRTCYTTSGKAMGNTWHNTLQCEQYTHFTSPLRRYVDIVTQRLLHACLNHQRNPYTIDELDTISVHCGEAVKRANRYESDIKKLTLATQLMQCSSEVLCFVSKIEEGRLYVCFTDILMKKFFRSQEASIHLKNLNASDIPEQDKKPAGGTTNLPKVFMWKAKMTSLCGSPRPFLANPDLQICSGDVDSIAKVEIDFFVPEPCDSAITKASSLKANRLKANIRPLTLAVPQTVWIQLQSYLQNGPTSSETMLELLNSRNTSSSSAHPAQATYTPMKSPLWIYKAQKPVEACEVFRVQLSASHSRQFLAPSIQMFEASPGLKICIEHNNNPAECFADKLTANASKSEYSSIDEYFERWEQVLLAEASIASLTDSELLLIKDVTLDWPELTVQTDSAGYVHYKLHMPQGKEEAGVSLTLPKEFVESSYEFFQFSHGDLACVRYSFEEDNVNAVFHMVVHHVKQSFENNVLTQATVYLKFVGERSNYISSAVKKSLRNSRTVKCEIQLIPLTLPHRRIYRSLHELAFTTNKTDLAIRVALGRVRTTNQDPVSVKDVLTAEQASLATSLWPLRPRTDGHGGRVKVNTFQRKAIDLACSNDFVMIQGPPGTGKSVTGAHLAYALAMKLRSEVLLSTCSQTNDDGHKEPRPCVMYCGPSQQSVNVVLDMLTLPDSPVRGSVKVIRVYSKAVEGKDFPGPKQNTDVFRHAKTNATCDPKYKDYALHHIIRRSNPEIVEMEKNFKKLHARGIIASPIERSRYTSLVFREEIAALRGDADIVLCTCNEASSHRILYSVKPVYCIIDECAMATEPECMVPIRRAEHVVLIGDHQQLQPVIQNRKAGVMGLHHSLFERYVRYQQPHMLRVQYRMHPALCEFPSKEFYEGGLQTDPSVKQRRNPEAHLQNFWPRGKNMPFVFCDVEGRERESHTGQKGAVRVGLESKENADEAKKIVQIAKVLLNRIKVNPKQIAAITPYSAQREEIKREMIRQKVTGVQVKTITESQGSEYGIVLLSTVRSKPLRDITTRRGERKKVDIGWLRANLGFITDQHQICVGITRCKYGLVIVGNQMLLSYDSTWKSLIQHYSDKGCVTNRDDFPPR